MSDVAVAVAAAAAMPRPAHTIWIIQDDYDAVGRGVCDHSAS